MDGLVATVCVKTDAEAVKAKVELLESKIFGIFSPVRYSLKEKHKVYVPYEQFIFNYELSRGNSILNKSGAFDRKGRVGIIYDLNEQHAFHFDLVEHLPLRAVEEQSGCVLEAQCSEQEALDRSFEIIRWKMLHRVFRGNPEVLLESRIRFYREAWQLTVECRGKEFVKYAYLDHFGTQNEHISGLKVRLDI